MQNKDTEIDNIISKVEQLETYFQNLHECYNDLYTTHITLQEQYLDMQEENITHRLHLDWMIKHMENQSGSIHLKNLQFERYNSSAKCKIFTISPDGKVVDLPKGIAEVANNINNC